MKTPVARTTVEKASKMPADRTSRGKPIKPGKFAKLLTTKREGDQALLVPSAAPIGLLPAPMAPVASRPAPAQPAVGLRTAEAIAREIVEHIESSPGERRSEVDIQFNSRTLDGLHVKLVHEGGFVSVQFTAASNAVAHVVDANMPALRQALESRRVPLASVTVRRGRPRRGGR